MTETESIPTPADLEELAAYVEDRLDAERRGRVEARLARDEVYAEILADTLDALDLEEREAREERVVSIDRGVRTARWRHDWRVLAAAAVVVLAVALALVFTSRPGPGTDWTRDLEAVALVASEDWTVSGLPTDRGRGVRGETSREAALEPLDAFELGVRWADVVVAVGALAEGSPSETSVIEARNLAARWVADAADWGVPSIARTVGILVEPLGGRAEEPIAIDLARAEAKVAELGGEAGRFFTAGRWAESARLAARAGDVEAVRRIWRDREVTSALASPEVEARRAEIAERLAGDPDPEALEAAFLELIAAALESSE